MKTISPLLANRQVLVWLCIYPTRESTSNWKRLAYIFVVCSIFITNLCALIASGAFISTYISIDLEASLYALSLIFAFSGATYVIFIALFMKKKIFALFESLTEIYRSSKDLIKSTFIY